MKIKIYTGKPHRFNKTLVVSNYPVSVDSEGFADVDENCVADCLIHGFELVDKDAVFTSKEESEKINKVITTINGAKAQADAILEKAKLDAEKIVSQAQFEKAKKDKEDQLDEKGVTIRELNKLTIEQLRSELKGVNIPESEWKNAKKSDLVKMIFNFIYSENEN